MGMYLPVYYWKPTEVFAGSFINDDDNSIQTIVYVAIRYN